MEFSEPFKFEEGERISFSKNEKYEIKLENVCFSYPSSNTEILKNINLTLKPFEKFLLSDKWCRKNNDYKVDLWFFRPNKGRVLLNYDKDFVYDVLKRLILMKG